MRTGISTFVAIVIGVLTSLACDRQPSHANDAADLSFAEELERIDPLQQAILKGDEDSVRRLLREGRDLNPSSGEPFSPLELAALLGNTEIARILVEHGADPSYRAPEKARYTALHNAAYRGNLDLARLLLEHGAHVNAVGQDGLTPLMSEAYSGGPEVARPSLGHGADPSVRDEEGKTAAEIAEKKGSAFIEYAEEVRGAVKPGA